MTETFVLESHHDRLLLHGLVVRPEQEPCRGILQVAHGMCEHKERYLPFLQEMADHGYLCIIHDHRGHGESVRQPEDLGYFYPDGGTAIVSDLYQVTRWIREQYPELPLYLFGHSMGSLVVRCYLKRYPDVPDGVRLRLSQCRFWHGAGRTGAGTARQEKGCTVSQPDSGRSTVRRIPETVSGRRQT